MAMFIYCIQSYWAQVIRFLIYMMGLPIPLTHGLCLLGLIGSFQYSSSTYFHLLHETLFQTKKLISHHWINDSLLSGLVD